jgi:hypothetical protein
MQHTNNKELNWNELLFITTSNYYYSIVTLFFSRVPVWGLRFVLEAFVVLRTQILHKVKDEENISHFIRK